MKTTDSEASSLPHSFISSSVVKEIASYHKPLTGLVPECVEDALKKVYQDQ